MAARMRRRICPEGNGNGWERMDARKRSRSLPGNGARRQAMPVAMKYNY